MIPKNKFFLILILLLLCFSATVSLNDSLNPIALYVVIPIAFGISFLQEMKFKPNVYVGILLLLYLWVLFTTFFSYDIDVSLSQLKRILGCALLSYIIAVQAKNEEIIKWLYIIILVLYLSSLEYANSNIISMMNEVGGRERVTDDTLNANTLAYYTFFSSFSIFVLGEFVKNNKFQKLYRMLFFIMIPLSFWIAIITASRQVLILQMPLIIILLYLRYFKYGTIKTRLGIIVLIVVSIMYFAGYVIEQYESSYLAERSNITVTEDNRFILVKECITLGLNNLFVGVGPGCVRFFTSERVFAHNTFLELWAGTGIIGMIIYISLLWGYFRNQIRRYKYTKDKMFVYFIVFGCFFLLDQVFYVFYTNMWLIGFFILVASHSDTYYNNKYGKIIRN